MAACCVPDFEGGEMKKGKKVKGNPRAKKPSGRSAPKRIEKPFRLEVGKTYEGNGWRIRVLARCKEIPNSFRVEVLAKPAGVATLWFKSWYANGSYFEDGAHGITVTREVRQPKVPVARRAKGSWA
jgi:hypothetical protein